MAEIIKKIANAGKIYSIGGGSTPVEEVEHKVVTQEEFDVIPQEEKVKNVYMIKGEAEPTPTPTPISGGVINGDILISGVHFSSDSNKVFFKQNDTYGVKLNNNIGITEYTHNSGSSGRTFVGATINNGDLYMCEYDSSVGNYYFVSKTGLDTYDQSVLCNFHYESGKSIDSKFADYIYIGYYEGATKTYIKIDYEGNITESTQEEFNSVPTGLYYKGLFYYQDGNDYASKTKEGEEVKRYKNVGTIDGIYNDKLYKVYTETSSASLSFSVANI